MVWNVVSSNEDTSRGERVTTDSRGLFQCRCRAIFLRVQFSVNFSSVDSVRHLPISAFTLFVSSRRKRRTKSSTFRPTRSRLHRPTAHQWSSNRRRHRLICLMVSSLIYLIGSPLIIYLIDWNPRNPNPRNPKYRVIRGNFSGQMDWNHCIFLRVIRICVIAVTF